MLKKNSLFLGFLIGIVVGVLAMNIIYLNSPLAYADATSGESAGIIAVTGLCANGISGLWVLDARDTKSSPSLCLYIPESGGRSGFSLTGARRIKYDLKLLQYQDKTRGNDFAPSVMAKKVEEMNQKEEDKAAKNK